MCVMRCAVQCNVPLIKFQKILRSKAQSHLCFPLCLMCLPQPRDGSALQQWGGADETSGPVQRPARTNPQHLTPPQAHLPCGRTWDSAGLGKWMITAVTRICSQSSENKTCFLSRLALSLALRADLERSSYLQGLWAALKICKCRLCKWGSWPCSTWSCFVIFSV